MLQEQTDYFAKKYPSASAQEIQAFITRNDQFIKDELDNIDPEILERTITRTSKTKKRTTIILIIAVIILCMFVASGIYNIIVVKQHAVAYYTEEIIDYGDIPSTDETDSTEYTSESFLESDAISE